MLKISARRSAHSLLPVRLLVAGQVALSLILVIGATLFIRTLTNLHGVDTGFEQEKVLTFGADLPPADGGTRLSQSFTDILRTTETLPGIRAATLSFPEPFNDSGALTMGVEIEGYAARPNERIQLDAVLVGPRFFEALGLPVLAGRDITFRDRAGSPSVVVINETMRRSFFGNANPLGRHVRVPVLGQEKPEFDNAEIVGVVRDAKHHGLRAAPVATIYVPWFQRPAPWATFEARVSAPAAALIPELRREAPHIRAGLRFIQFQTIHDQIGRSLSRERLMTILAGFFGAVALLLACLGLYGVMAHAVIQRTGEIGIRMALGAARAGVLWMVLRQAFLLAAAGIAVGVPAALAMTGWTRSLLFGLEPNDPPTIAGAATLLLAVALGAAYQPARRASRVDPMTALRYE